MKNRSIVMCIILSIITCGIYGIYWFVCLNNEMNEAAPDDYTTSGGMAFLFTLLTCGIYTFYWNYKMGVKMNALQDSNNGSNHILFLLLSFFGLSIVNYCLMQSEINKIAE